MTAADVTSDAPAAAADLPSPRAPWWRRFLSAFVPPLVALVAGWAMLSYRSGRHDGNLGPARWGRWDTGQYLGIARKGYTATWQCSPHSLPPHAPPGPHLCGNAGWFPGYPAGIRLLSEVAGISLPVAALLLSWACWYVALLLMWRLLADSRSRPTRWLCLLLAAFFPGQIYFAALFPISLCVAGMLACLYAASRETRPLLSGGLALLAGAVVAYSYITPVALAPALTITALLAVRGRRRLQMLAGAAGILAGFGAVLLTMQLAVGTWNAYFLSTAKFGVGVHSPLETLVDHLHPIWQQPPAGREVLTVTAWQTLLTVGLLTLATVTTVGRAVLASRRARSAGPEGIDTSRGAAIASGEGGSAGDPGRVAVAQPVTLRTRYVGWYAALSARISPGDLLFLLASGGVWLVPYIAGGRVSSYRSEAFVVLAVPLLRRLPAWLLLPLVAAAAFVSWRLSPYFFDSTLV
jgi:hypothetical protein